MSIRNRKFSRRNYSSEAAIAGHRDGAPGADPMPPAGQTAFNPATGTPGIEGQLNTLQNHRGGCGDDFAKEG